VGLSEVFRDLYLAPEHLGSPPPLQPLGLGPRVCMTTRPPRRTQRLGSGSHAHFGIRESAGAEGGRRGRNDWRHLEVSGMGGGFG